MTFRVDLEDIDSIDAVATTEGIQSVALDAANGYGMAGARSVLGIFDETVGCRECAVVEEARLAGFVAEGKIVWLEARITNVLW